MLKLILIVATLCLVSGATGTRRLLKAPKTTPVPKISPLMLQKLRGSLFPGNDTWDAGYVSFPAAGTTFHFFSWTLEARIKQPGGNPIIFWFTGGPGCSSVLALFAENGAWNFPDPSQPNLAVNPFSWNTNAHVVFVDQPVQTGFSYSDKDVYERDEDEVAEDVFSFLKGYFAKYPKFVNLPMFVVGESYGGHYVPAISNKIVSEIQAGNTTMNFQGCAVGNGLVDPRSQYPQYANFSYLNHLISKFDLEKYAVEIKPCQAALSAGLYETAYVLCNGVMQGILGASGIQNVYNIKAGCAVPPLCYDFSGATTFLNQPAVQQAISVPGIEWESCNMAVNGEFSRDWMHSMAPRLLNILAANKTVLIYSGKLDFICNYIGGRAWTRNLQWSGQSSFNNAQPNSWDITLKNGTRYHAGTSKIFQNFAWLEVEGAGHMVPDQPQAALQMINRYIQGGWRA